jgi:Fe-coproporphyrin III synthase
MTASQTENLATILSKRTGRITQFSSISLQVTNNCNSKCIMCDYWKTSSTPKMSVANYRKVINDLVPFGLKSIMITGGEPLLRQDLWELYEELRSQGFHLILNTSGVLLNKNMKKVKDSFHSVLISLDSHYSDGYKKIRGVDRFDEVIASIKELKAQSNIHIILSHTLQADNISELENFLKFSIELGVNKISLRPLDVTSVEGFNRSQSKDGKHENGLPSLGDIKKLEESVKRIKVEFCDQLESGLIAPDSFGLDEIIKYFYALHGEETFPIKTCDVIHHSGVVEENGDFKPCFFTRSSFNLLGHDSDSDIGILLNSDLMKQLRKDFGRDKFPECRECILPYCSA